MISNIYEFLDKSVAKYPHKTLFVSGKNCISYLEFSHKSSALASKILEFGLNKKPVLIILPKSIEALIAWIECLATNQKVRGSNPLQRAISSVHNGFKL